MGSKSDNRPHTRKKLWSILKPLQANNSNNYSYRTKKMVDKIVTDLMKYNKVNEAVNRKVIRFGNSDITDQFIWIKKIEADLDKGEITSQTTRKWQDALKHDLDAIHKQKEEREQDKTIMI